MNIVSSDEVVVEVVMMIVVACGIVCGLWRREYDGGGIVGEGDDNVATSQGGDGGDGEYA